MNHFIQGREIWCSEIRVGHNLPSYGKSTNTVEEKNLEIMWYEGNPINSNLNTEITQVHNKCISISIHTIQHMK